MRTEIVYPCFNTIMLYKVTKGAVCTAIGESPFELVLSGESFLLHPDQGYWKPSYTEVEKVSTTFLISSGEYRDSLYEKTINRRSLQDLSRSPESRMAELFLLEQFNPFFATNIFRGFILQQGRIMYSRRLNKMIAKKLIKKIPSTKSSHAHKIKILNLEAIKNLARN